MEEMKRGLNKIRTGTVVSDKMNKSIMVSVERLVRHPIYGKYVKQRVKYMAHDEKGECKTGDKVEIVETRPLSKVKRWKISKILEKA
jgi:small subunit ribosomal protein S17